MFIETPGLADNSQEQSSGDTLGDIVEVAQAAAPGGETIGQISAVQGTVFITHTDGSKTPAGDGAAIFQGDLVETGDGGAVGITFADNSTFSLADNGSMIIDEMVYDPATKTGASALSVAEGVFTFVSGEIAKTGVDAMTITTPVAVIGIRGTSGGGKAGAEGTNNTFSLFAGQDGVIGEMTITTQGGSQTMSSPNQTTQIASAYIPPTIPVTLPAAAVARFYAKAAAVAPTPIITQPTSATGEPGDAGPTGQTGGPAGDTPADGANVEQAAQEAFEQALAQGGSLEDAMAAAVDGAAEAGLDAVLAINPDHFGTTGGAVMDRIIDNVLLGVTGQIDPLGAGDGSGTGAGEFTDRTFFSDEIGHFIDNELGDFEGGFFDDVLFGGEDNEFFGLFFDDAFDDFNDQFFFGDDIFGDVFLFGDDIFDPNIIFQGDILFDGFINDPALFDPIIFGDEFDLTSASDNFTGAAGNTEFILDQALFTSSVYGGSDIINDSGGANDRITFEGVDNVAIRMTEKSGDASRVTIDIQTLSAGLNLTSTSVTTAVNTSPINTLDVTKDVDDLQALDSSFANFNTGGVLLFGALDVTGSDAGYIVAGGSVADTINLSGFNTSATIGSIIFGKGGNDTLTGTSSIDDIEGGAGNDIIDGNGGINSLNGDAGDDTFNITVTGSSNDIDGGVGTADALSYSGLLNTTISTFNFGTFGSLGISRSVSAAVVGGDSVFSVETLVAGQGDDIFNFNTISLGFTSISGGTGNDSFTFNTVGAQIAAVIDGGSAGSDSITLNAGTFLAGTGGVQNVELITGSSGNDTVKFVGTAGTVNAGAGDDTVIIDQSLIEALTLSLNGGTGTADQLTINALATSNLSAAELVNISAFETWKLASNQAYTLVTAAGNVASGASLSIDATSVTSAAVTVDATLETDGTLNFNGGAGISTLTVAQAMLAGAATAASLSGGSGGSDALTISGGGTLGAAKLANISGWETWTLSTNAATTLTLNTANAGTGTLTIDATAINANGTFGTIDASAETDGGTVNVSVTTSALDTTTATLTGGSGTSDVLSLSSSIVLDATELGNVSGFETWTLVGNSTFSLTLADGNAGTGTLTINGAAATSSALVIDGTAEADTGSSLIITGGGVGDALTGGAGSDTLTGGAGIDTLTGGAGADTFFGDGAADIINLGVGATAGTDADIIAYNAISDGAATELVNNFIAADDIFQLDISGFALSAGTGALSAANYVEDTLANITSNTGGILTGNTDITVIVFTDTTNLTQLSNAIAFSIGSSGAANMTSYFAVYNDGTDTFLAFDSNAATGGTGAELTILDSDNAGTSVTATDLTEANFTLVA